MEKGTETDFMGKVIQIEWQSSKHQIFLDASGQGGWCNTHEEFVTQHSRCSHFPPQSAMWTDLWNTALKQEG